MSSNALDHRIDALCFCSALAHLSPVRRELVPVPGSADRNRRSDAVFMDPSWPPGPVGAGIGDALRRPHGARCNARSSGRPSFRTGCRGCSFSTRCICLRSASPCPPICQSLPANSVSVVPSSGRPSRHHLDFRVVAEIYCRPWWLMQHLIRLRKRRSRPYRMGSRMADFGVQGENGLDAPTRLPTAPAP
jgi:hypothetical protein